MKKTTLELRRDENHVYNYGLTYIPEQEKESSVLNKLVEWSAGKSITIYKHLLRVEQEQSSDSPSQSRFYETHIPQVGYIKIPYCHRITYLDIYYQDK